MKQADWLGNEYGVGDLVVYAAASGRSITMVLGRVVDLWLTARQHCEWVRLAPGELPPEGEKAALRVKVQPLQSSRWKQHDARDYYVDTRTGKRIDPLRGDKHVLTAGHYRDRNTHERLTWRDGGYPHRVGYYTDDGRRAGYEEREYISTKYQPWVERRTEDGPRPVTLTVTDNIVKWDGQWPTISRLSSRYWSTTGQILAACASTAGARYVAPSVRTTRIVTELPVRESILRRVPSSAMPAALRAAPSTSSSNEKGWTTLERATGRKAYLEQAAQVYHDQLATRVRPGRDPSGVIGYLSEHAIDFAIAGEYQLGYVAEPIMGDQRFTGMLAIPYLSLGGVDAIKFRSLGDRRGAKYAQHNGQKHRLYNTPALHSAGNTIGITEGELDALVATERLGLPSIGVPGTQHWDSRLWKPLFHDFTTVVILADGDEPGREFASKLAEELGWRAMIAQCPEGMDVSSMAAAGRTAELRELYSTQGEAKSHES